MIDEDYSYSCHFCEPSDSIYDLGLLSALLEMIIFDVMELEATHYKTIDWVDYEEPSSPICFYFFEGLFDKVVALAEIRSFLIDKQFLMFLELGLVHLVIS